MDIEKDVNSLELYSGRPMVPLQPYSKFPIGKAWQDNPITVEKAIANGSTGAGYLIEKDVFVLDVDVHRGKAGLDQLADLELDAGFSATDYPRVRTASGGLHVYMGRPAGYEVVGKLPDSYPHIDIKANGQVVAAGSVVDLNGPTSKGGNRLAEAVKLALYKWDDGSPPLTAIKAAPPALLEMLQRGTTIGAAGAETGDDWDGVAHEVITIAHLRKLLSQLDAMPLVGSAGSYEMWLRIGMACHYATNGDHDAAEAWAEWCSVGQYEGNTLEALNKWQSFSALRGANSAVGVGTLRHLIKQQYESGHTALKPDYDPPLTTAERRQRDLGNVTEPEMGNFDDMLEALPVKATGVELRDILLLVSRMGKMAAQDAISKISEKTNLSEAKINKLLKIAIDDQPFREDVADTAEIVATMTLEEKFTIKGKRTVAVTGDKASDIFIYSGAHWAVREANTFIKQKIQETWQKHRNIINPEIKSANIINETLELLRIMVYTDDSFMRLTEMPKPVFNCTNGELWFTTLPEPRFKLRKHNPDHKIMQEPKVAYNAAAKCPRIDDFVNKVFHLYGEDKPAMIKYFYEILGAILLPQKFDMEYMFFFYGDANSGKSKLLELFSYLLGNESVISCSMDDVGNSRSQFGSYKLIGALLVVAEELQENSKYPMDTLKLYIGNTANTAEKKAQATPVHFVNKATLVQLTNVVPKIYHLDASKERRIQVLPFRNSSYRIGENGVKDNPHGVFPVDNNIGSVMQDEEEMAGFLNHIIAGWLRLARNSFQMRPPKVAEAARQEFMKQASPVRRFLGECTDYAEPGIKHAKYRVPKQDLYHAFERWCREEGIRSMPMQTSFTQEAAQIMGRYGIEEGNSGNVRQWLGLQLTTEFDAEDDWGDL